MFRSCVGCQALTGSGTAPTAEVGLIPMITTRSRVVLHNRVVYAQVDFLQVDGFTRVTGLTASTLVLNTFFDNTPQPWLLVNGIPVTDAQVASGNIYFNEVPGSPGYYNVRWRPNATGYWRMILTYVPGQQIEALDFDIFQGGSQGDTGLNSSFIRPDCR